jgi:hypothetical protein
MEINRKLAVILGLGGAALAALPVLAQRGPTTGPVARYDMRAGTVSGFAAMGGGMGGAMGMMLGGGGNRVQHELHLRLGTSQAPAKGTPKADHFMPAGAKLGKSVALVTPKEERVPDDFQGQKPKGRLLVFWGCGEHAPKGQPVVIDFAKLAAGQVPPGLWTSTVIRDWGPNPGNSKTFGRWPAEDGKFAKPDSALPGAHRVAANYSPEIAFTLAKDFMAPVSLSNTAQASGSTLLKWGALPEATGYLAWMWGGKRGPGDEMGDMVMWTSSASRQFGGGLGDWLTTAQAASLVKDRTLLPPSATTCTVPAEVKKAGPDFAMGMFTAFGPQEDFSYPPRPADPKAAWNLQWTVRVRHRSMTSWMDMPGMAGMQGQDSRQPQQNCKPKKGLGGLLGGVLAPGSC